MKILILSVLFLVTICIIGQPDVVLAGGEKLQHGGDIVFIKPVKAVIFSHKRHTVDLGLHCDWCHGEIFAKDALHIEQSTDLTMESFCNEKYCGTCHNGDISFSTQNDCTRCHIGVKGYNELIRQGRLDPEETSDSEDGKVYIQLKEVNR